MRRDRGRGWSACRAAPSEGTSTTSQSMPCSALQPVGGGERARHHQWRAQDRRVLARPARCSRRRACRRSRRPAPRPSPHRASCARRRSPGRDRAPRPRAGRSRRAGLKAPTTFEAGNRHAPVLDALRMLGAEARAGAVAGAHAPAGYVTCRSSCSGSSGSSLAMSVEADRDEVGEHDLGDRLRGRSSPRPSRRRGSPAPEIGQSRTRLGTELFEETRRSP